ncbi:ribonuclease-like 3 isoform X2 [Parambassis ranga]|nr:ribonuclease-like 3 isoform X2 [Parambassis ranga]XP_028272026.1 ribonuclease-like 3 isoform X2 [Parambassis ranga]
MRIPLACLLLLSTTVLSQPFSLNDRYKKFIEQHINAQMSANRCDAVINDRGISKTGSNECKETNTFILSTTGHVRAICEGAGVPYGDMTRSTIPFPVVICSLKNSGARLRHCQYRGRPSTSYIAIRCENRLPVHFDRDIVVVN